MFENSINVVWWTWAQCSVCLVYSGCVLAYFDRLFARLYCWLLVLPHPLKHRVVSAASLWAILVRIIWMTDEEQGDWLKVDRSAAVMRSLRAALPNWSRWTGNFFFFIIWTFCPHEAEFWSECNEAGRGGSHHTFTTWQLQRGEK